MMDCGRSCTCEYVHSLVRDVAVVAEGGFGRGDALSRPARR